MNWHQRRRRAGTTATRHLNVQKILLTIILLCTWGGRGWFGEACVGGGGGGSRRGGVGGDRLLLLESLAWWLNRIDPLPVVVKK